MPVLGFDDVAALRAALANRPTLDQVDYRIRRAGSAFPLPIVATRGNSYYNGLSSLSGSPTGSNARVRHIAYTECSDLRLVYGNWYQSTDTDTAGLQNITVRASIEYPSGTFHPVYFLGKRDVVIEPGATVVCDPVGIEIPGNRAFWTRTYVTVTTGGTDRWPTGTATNTVVGDGATTTAGEADATTSGTISATLGFIYSPMAVLGVPSLLSAIISLWGDSIPYGTGDFGVSATDSVNGVYGYDQSGYVYRALVGKIPYYTGCKSGATVKNIVASLTAKRYRMMAASGCSHAIVTYGINDCASSDSLATIQANLTTLWTALAQRGIKVLQTTLTPRTTSTDGWRTLANQTLFSTNSADTKRLQLNAWIRTIPAPLTNYIELADMVESSRDSGKWAVQTADLAGGTATAGASGSLTDSTKTWTTNQWAGKLVTLVSGTGSVITRYINSNTATVLTINSTFTTPPDATSVYAIHAGRTQDGLHPSIDGHIDLSAGVPVTLFAL